MQILSNHGLLLGHANVAADVAAIVHSSVSTAGCLSGGGVFIRFLLRLVMRTAARFAANWLTYAATLGTATLEALNR